MGRVIVRAGSRLHAGFYYAGPGRPYSWGSAGFYIATPRVTVEAEECPGGARVGGAGHALDAAREALERLGYGGVCLEVREAPPRHVGLGSTTQIMLSAACAARLALGEGGCSPGEVALLARRLGRGRVSGAGSIAFAYGGFVVDAGSPDPRGPTPLFRLEIPRGWAFIVAIPRLPRGLSGPREEELLSRPWRPRGEVERLMSSGLLRLAVGISRGDLREALEGLRMMQLGTGMYFSGLQGGAYRSDLQAIVGEAERSGLVMAQSSWGPTLYTITTRDAAWDDAALVKSVMREVGVEGEVIISEPLNAGARIGYLSR